MGTLPKIGSLTGAWTYQLPRLMQNQPPPPTPGARPASPLMGLLLCLTHTAPGQMESLFQWGTASGPWSVQVLGDDYLQILSVCFPYPASQEAIKRETHLHLPQRLTLLQTMVSGNLRPMLPVGPGRGSYNPVIMPLVLKGSEAALSDCLKQGSVFMCKQARQPARPSPPTWKGRGLNHRN